MMEAQEIAVALCEQGRKAQEAQLTFSDMMRALQLLGVSEEARAELRFDLGGQPAERMNA